MYTYFLLRENAQLGAVHKKFEELVEKYIGPEVEKFMGTTLQANSRTRWTIWILYNEGNGPPSAFRISR